MKNISWKAWTTWRQWPVAGCMPNDPGRSRYYYYNDVIFIYEEESDRWRTKPDMQKPSWWPMKTDEENLQWYLIPASIPSINWRTKLCSIEQWALQWFYWPVLQRTSSDDYDWPIWFEGHCNWPDDPVLWPRTHWLLLLLLLLCWCAIGIEVTLTGGQLIRQWMTAIPDNWKDLTGQTNQWEGPQAVTQWEKKNSRCCCCGLANSCVLTIQAKIVSEQRCVKPICIDKWQQCQFLKDLVWMKSNDPIDYYHYWQYYYYENDNIIGYCANCY